MRIMHIATENKWFLRKVRKPFLKPFINIITVLSHQLLSPVADSLLYLTLDVFFEVLDHCSQNSSRGGHSCGWRSSEIKTVVVGARSATEAFPFLICYTLFTDLQMRAHFPILFQPCSPLGIISTAKFFVKSLL